MLTGLGVGKDTVGKFGEYYVVLQPPVLAECSRPKMAALDRAVFDCYGSTRSFPLSLLFVLTSGSLYSLAWSLLVLCMNALKKHSWNDGNIIWLLDLIYFTLAPSFSITMRCP